MKSRTKQASIFLAVLISLVILGHLLGVDDVILHGPKLQFGH